MQFPILALALVLVAFTVPASAQSSPAGNPLSLAEAMRLAEAGNTAVRSREAQLAAAEGARSEAASPFFNNPELSVEKSRRRPPPPNTLPICRWPREVQCPNKDECHRNCVRR